MIYLDSNATTCPLPGVVEAVSEVLRSNWGNASSVHYFGHKARKALEGARNTVARAFGAELPSSIIFTSSGTESINLACTSLLSPEITRILVASTDHSAVLLAAEGWAEGRSVGLIPVDSDGRLDLNFLEAELIKRRSLVCVAHANNETGVVTDISSVASLCRRHNALLHVDAVQALGKIPFSLEDLQCDAASLSAHKFHGPPGCGILYLKSGSPLRSQQRILFPGRQERGLRGGTENLPAIVGCETAIRMLDETLDCMGAVRQLRDELEAKLLSAIPQAEVHGIMSDRLPNTISIYCPRRNASDLVATLSSLGVAVSAGAACSNGTSPSHVIRAMGFSERRANSTVRISLSRFTGHDQVMKAHEAFENAYAMTPPTQ